MEKYFAVLLLSVVMQYFSKMSSGFCPALSTLLGFSYVHWDVNTLLDVLKGLSEVVLMTATQRYCYIKSLIHYKALRYVQTNTICTFCSISMILMYCTALVLIHTAMLWRVHTCFHAVIWLIVWDIHCRLTWGCSHWLFCVVFVSFRTVHYEGGAVSIHARSLWRLETLRVAWVYQTLENHRGLKCAITHICTAVHSSANGVINHPFMVHNIQWLQKVN